VLFAASSSCPSVNNIGNDFSQGCYLKQEGYGGEVESNVSDKRAYEIYQKMILVILFHYHTHCLERM